MNLSRNLSHQRHRQSKPASQVKLFLQWNHIIIILSIDFLVKSLNTCIIYLIYLFLGIIGPYLSFDWIGALIFALLGPFILVSLHTLCTKSSCKPALPFDKIPKTLASYWDREAFLLVVGFMLVLRVLSLLPLGGTVRSVSGKDLRMNGFVSLLILMASMPMMVYKKVNLR